MSPPDPVVRFVPVGAVERAASRTAPDWLARRLSERELLQWQERRPGRVRAEWAAGRLAAKAAVRRLSDRCGGPAPHPSEIEVEPSRGAADLGRPTTTLPYAVSISHSRGLAAAAAGTTTVGVDVEIRDRHWPDPVLAQLDDVTTALPTGHRPDPATTWTCVEAVLKHLGCGLRHGVTAVGLTGIAPGGGFTWVDRPPLRDRSRDADGRVGLVRRVGRHTMALVWGDVRPGVPDGRGAA